MGIDKKTMEKLSRREQAAQELLSQTRELKSIIEEIKRNETEATQILNQLNEGLIDNSKTQELVNEVGQKTDSFLVDTQEIQKAVESKQSVQKEKENTNSNSNNAKSKKPLLLITIIVIVVALLGVGA